MYNSNRTAFWSLHISTIATIFLWQSLSFRIAWVWNFLYHISVYFFFYNFLALPISFSLLFAPFKLFPSFSLALTYNTGLDCFHCIPSNHNSNNNKRKKKEEERKKTFIFICKLIRLNNKTWNYANCVFYLSVYTLIIWNFLTSSSIFTYYALRFR